MADTIAVKITAEQINFEREMSAAQAQLRAVQAELRRTSDIAATSNISGGLKPQLDQLATTAGTLKTRIADLVDPLKAVRAETENMGHGSIAVATREFRALFDELSSGRTRMTPGTLAIIATRVFDLSTSALIAVGSVAALTGGIAYLIVKSIEAENALNRFDAKLAFEGNTRLSIAAMNQLAAAVGSDGQEIVGSWARVEGATNDSVQGMTAATELFISATGEKAPEAVKTLQGILDGGKKSAADFAKAGLDLTDAELSMWKQAELTGDSNAKLAAAIDILTNHSIAASAAIIKSDAGWTSWSNDIRLAAGWVEDLSLKMLPLSSYLEAAIADWKLAAEGLSGFGDKLKELTAWLPNWSSASAVQNKLIEETTVKFDKEAAAARAATQAMQQNALQMNSDMQYASDPGKKPQKGMGGKQGASTVGADEIAATQAAIVEIQQDLDMSDAERLAKEHALWDQLLAGNTLNAKQIADVRKFKDQETLAELKATMKEQETLLKGNAQTEIDIAKETLAAKKAELEEELKDHEITADQWLQRSRQALNDEEALDISALGVKYSNRDKDRAQYAAYVDELLKIYAKFWQDNAALDKAGLAAHQAELRAEIQESRQAFGDITQASDTMISDMIAGQKTFGQIALSVVSTLVTKEIQQFARAAIAHLFYTQEELAADKSLGGESVIWNLLFEGQKTAGTVAGETARVAAKTAGAAAGSAADAAAGSTSILNDAYEAAAGAYKAVVGIPIIGPVLAPVAAGVAFTGVMAFDKIAAFEQGTWQVPSTGAAMIHKDEMILPAPFAQSVRENGGMGGGDHFHFTINAVDAASVQRLLMNNSGAVMNAITYQKRNLHSFFAQGMRGA